MKMAMTRDLTTHPGNSTFRVKPISLLFMDAAKIIRKYELRERYDYQVNAGIGPNALFIDEAMHSFLQRIRKTKRNSGFLCAIFSWAVKYKKEFRTYAAPEGMYRSTRVCCQNL